MGSFCRFVVSAEAGFRVQPHRVGRRRGGRDRRRRDQEVPRGPGGPPHRRIWVRFAKNLRRGSKRLAIQRGRITGSLEGEYSKGTAGNRGVGRNRVGGEKEYRGQNQ